MTNFTSFSSAAGQNTQCYIVKCYSFFIAFMTKLFLHMSALPSDPRPLLQVNMPDGGESDGSKNNPLRVKSHQILLHKANLKATILPNVVEHFHSGNEGGEGRL